MTDPSVERGSSDQNHDNIEDAVVVDESTTDETTAGKATTDESAAPAAAPLVEPDVEPSVSSTSSDHSDSVDRARVRAGSVHTDPVYESATPVYDSTIPAYDDSTVEAHAEPMEEPVVVYEPEIVTEAEAETITTETASGAATAVSDEPRVVYVTAPTPPKVAGNRGFGVFMALAATVVFAIIFTIVVVLINTVATGRVGISFVQAPSFYVPIAFFALGAIIIALIVNRAGWGAHVFSSIIVGLIVYFGTVGVLLLSNGVIQNTPEQAQLLFAQALINPLVIAAGLLAREVALWTGAIVAKRGRKVTVRNTETRAQWEAELAEKSAARH